MIILVNLWLKLWSLNYFKHLNVLKCKFFVSFLRNKDISCIKMEVI